MASLTLVNGIVGGLVATVVMTVFMMALGDDSPPPTAALWAKYVGDGPPENYVPQGMALHFLYGLVAAAVFVLAVPAIGLRIGSVTTAVLFGLVYGVVLVVGAAGFWMNVVLGMDPDASTLPVFAFFHLVYGVVLGVWLQLGVL